MKPNLDISLEFNLRPVKAKYNPILAGILLNLCEPPATGMNPFET